MVAVVLYVLGDSAVWSSADPVVLAFAISSYRTLLQSASFPGAVEHSGAVVIVQRMAGVPAMVVPEAAKTAESALRIGR